MNCKSNDQFELNKFVDEEHQIKDEKIIQSNQRRKKITFNHKKSYGKIIVKAKSCKMANQHYFLMDALFMVSNV